MEKQLDAYRITSPATGAVVGEVTPSAAQDVIDAVARGRAAQPAWAARPYQARARVLLNFHDRLLENPDAIMDIIQAETGKSRRDALAEIVVVAGTIRHYASRGAAYLRPERRRAAYPLFTAGYLHYRPHGVVGIIAPWNFPFILTIAEAVPALLAGNAAVVKPATLTPLSALWGAEQFHAAGLPPDLLHIVPGSGRTVGDALIDHADFIGFTGSTAVGRRVAARCGERLVPYSMELGGKNAMIVLEDADIEEATDNLLDGAFSNGGQVCISIERVYILDAIYDAFVARLVEKTRAVRLGCTPDFETDVGSLISPDQLEAVQAHVEDARAKGARVLAGGAPRPDIGPLFYAP
ncbi:MAG: aldehyde dehydrogenase family protein, partial [Anaerolineae bacterium]|nr:aldehyde dehydrogenase family protein [Anaerolineae bacterium]